MSDPSAPGPREFVTTLWSLVAAARTDGRGGSEARRAMEALCTAYWYPLYAFVRSRGYASADAQDLTQAFFARIIEAGGFGGADRERGRFRSYLLGAMKHFLANEWRRGRARKRGGGAVLLELDALEPEARYALEAASADEPETVFDRAWARQCVDHAMTRLRAEYRDAGKAEVFDALRLSLTGEELSRRDIAGRLGMTEGAVKVAIHRLRRRYRDLLRAEVRETVVEPADIEDEMRYLVAILRRNPR